MDPKPTPAPEDADDDLHIRLDLAGLAALMKAIEGAMAEGRGELRLPCNGVRVTCCGSPDALRTLTLVWRPDGDDDGELEPAPLPRTRVLETVG